MSEKKPSPPLTLLEVVVVVLAIIAAIYVSIQQERTCKDAGGHPVIVEKHFTCEQKGLKP